MVDSGAMNPESPDRPTADTVPERERGKERGPEPGLTPLPPGHTVRRPTNEDFDEVLALLVAADLALVGETDWCAMELGLHWRRPRFSLERDAWVVEPEEGGLVAWAWSFNDEPEGPPMGFFCLHPDHSEPALGRHLLALIERRAREQLASATWGKPTVSASFLEQDDLKRELHRDAGYVQVRVFERLGIAAAEIRVLDEQPAGIDLRPMRHPDDEHAVHECVEEAFADHFRYAPIPFEEFFAPFHDTPPEKQVWLVACDGPEIVGAAFGLSMERSGYVDILAVRRPWRGRHIGLALLIETFVRLRDLGHDQLTLGVDATNPTGAAHLYRRAGMSLRRRSLHFEKLLP